MAVALSELKLPPPHGPRVTPVMPSIGCSFACGRHLALFLALDYCNSRDLRGTLDSASMSTTTNIGDGQALRDPRDLKSRKSRNLLGVMQHPLGRRVPSDSD